MGLLACEKIEALQKALAATRGRCSASLGSILAELPGQLLLVKHLLVDERLLVAQAWATLRN